MAEEPTALDAALRVLRARDFSAAELDRRLAAKGFGEDERGGALEVLERTGLVDDRRYAESRASALAARGAGDGLVRHDLGQAGVDVELVDDAIAQLEPERERALRIAERRGYGPKTARYLGSKGFSEDSVGALVAAVNGDELG